MNIWVETKSLLEWAYKYLHPKTNLLNIDSLNNTLIIHTRLYFKLRSSVYRLTEDSFNQHFSGVTCCSRKSKTRYKSINVLRNRQRRSTTYWIADKRRKEVCKNVRIKQKLKNYCIAGMGTINNNPQTGSHEVVKVTHWKYTAYHS